MASRDTLEAEAVTLGLASVSTYQNKKVVESAIERVKNGEDAAVVDNELQQAVDASEQPQNGAGEPEPLNSGLDPEIIEDDTTVDDDDESDDDTTEDDEVVDDEQAAKPDRKKKTVKNRNGGHAVAFDEFGRPLMRA